MKFGLTVALAGLGLAATALWMLRPRPSSYSFQQKTVVITGGSRGLGLLLARRFAREGARVVLVARDEAELRRACQQLSLGPSVLAIPCDITLPEQVQPMVDEVLRRFGHIDVLINNAGRIDVGPLETMTAADYRKAMDVHFWGPLQVTLSVIESMRKQKQGRIVNISSIGGLLSVPHLLPYSASKFALSGLSEGLRAELAKDGVWVTTVYPGLMRTGSPIRGRFKGQYRSEYAWFSIVDSLPFLSMSANRAAKQIVRACRQGQAHVVLGTPAKLAVIVHHLLPSVFSDLMTVINRLLPKSEAQLVSKRGVESRSAVTESPLTWLSQTAAQQNNELLEVH